MAIEFADGHSIDHIMIEIREALDEIAQRNDGHVEKDGVPAALALLMVAKIMADETRYVEELSLSLKYGKCTKIWIQSERIDPRFYCGDQYDEMIRREE